MNFEKAIEPFHMGELQDFVNMCNHWKKNGIPIEDVIKYFENEKEKAENAIEAAKTEQRSKVIEEPKKEFKERRCPECNIPLQIRPLCAKGNREGYRSHWFCPECVFEEYSKNDIRTEIKLWGNR